LLAVTDTFCVSSRHKTTGVDTDLGQMFLSCSKAVAHEWEGQNGSTICLLSNTFLVQFNSGVQISPAVDEDDSEFAPQELFARIEELTRRNDALEEDETKFEQKYTQLLGKHEC